MSVLAPTYAPLAMVGRNRFWQRGEAGRGPVMREVTCPHCGEVLRVAVRAINTRCTACHKHLMVEDVVIRGDSVQTRILTCGTILVEPAGRFAGVLQGWEVVIMGRVMGTVIGTQRVEVTGTGKVAGTIATRVLRRHERAVIDGEIQMLGGGSRNGEPKAT